MLELGCENATVGKKGLSKETAIYLVVYSYALRRDASTGCPKSSNRCRFQISGKKIDITKKGDHNRDVGLHDVK